METVATADRSCVFPGCDRPPHCRDWCRAHYEQQRRGYELRPLLGTVSRVCRVDGCDRGVVVRRKQLCATHYDRERSGLPVEGPSPRPCGLCARPFVPKRRQDAVYCDECAYRAYHVKSAYGLDGSALVDLLALQDGGCAVCRSPLVIGTKGAIHVDHDHKCCSGERSCGACVRGLLCGPCNRSIGLMNDDPARLRAAASYLKRTARFS